MSAFKDIRDYVAIPRVLSLKLSPDGSRLVSAVQSLNPDGKSYGTALWSLPLDAEPYRLTRSAKGETGTEFTAAGDVLFTSRRPDPTVKDSDEEVPALWLLPRGGGEARQVATRPGGIGAAKTAGDVVVFASEVLPGDEATDEERRKARKDAGISAILHEGYPVRYWDHDLGPGRTRLFAARLGADRLEDVRDLTPDSGSHLDDHLDFALTPDGATVVTTWTVPLDAGRQRTEVVAVDVATGERRTLFAADDHDFEGPLRISPDGARVACSRSRHTTLDVSARSELWIGDLATGEGRAYADDLFPMDLAWAPDSSAVYLAADHQGRRPVFRVSPRRRLRKAHHRRRRLPRAQRLARRPLRLRAGAAVTTPPPPRPGSTWPPARSPSCPLPLPRWSCRARSRRSPRWPTTGRRSAAGWCCRRTPRPRTPRPSCCGSTAAPSPRGTTGPGAGTRGSWRRTATRSCCPTPRCPPGTAST
ncbi:hypothetical protein [Nonomuraea roseola]|uniref:TolB family protein n=1 Tax=Nonomuraea roseola TaxID=46179 RepID=UPI0031F965ED